VTRRRRIALGCLGTALLAFGACYAALHQAWRYEGGKIHDSGVISYPRFTAPFRPIPFNRAATYSFHFKRFPADQAVVMLNTPTAPHREQLEKLRTRLSIRVEDERAVTRCEASGFPAGLGPAQAFVTSAPVHATGIWLMSCNGFSVERCDPCTLTLTISDVDPATPSIPLVPTLEGGGIELP
jgi:hypothetical protein